ncbi:SubName: Full=Uncharacterized protein {ECO:0000313/EMBL:CCA74569.1} [Serendipita indica DSM 11827]|uniref:Mid2 domain-containing protein n=1 Tax=Serendipita indica (strain DSM 11827) TaxID=1109443 RepID=G4TTC7_SERID|nr:SubName: Full=Uncharacterized protein {ECO:0000313/EMBL:CCA74569.1} [Serendipita indica DSM 11827]CCA74569.1 hypothetical protein PIIN_08521 [Serendipita indica DSM 11827]
MFVSLVLQPLSTLLVFAVASVAAHPSAGDGTVPHVYDPGFSKHPSRMNIPGTLRVRQRMRAAQWVIQFVALHRRPSAAALDAAILGKLVATAVAAILVTRARHLEHASISSLSVISVASISYISTQSSLSAAASSSTSSPPGGTIAGTTGTGTPEPTSKNNTGAIVGGVVGGVAAICLLVGLLLFLLHKQKKQSAGTSEVASTYTAQPMMGQHPPSSPGFPGNPGSPVNTPSAYGFPSAAPTPALVYNQNEMYPNRNT